MAETLITLLVIAAMAYPAIRVLTTRRYPRNPAPPTPRAGGNDHGDQHPTS